MGILMLKAMAKMLRDHLKQNSGKTINSDSAFLGFFTAPFVILEIDHNKNGSEISENIRDDLP